jgi:hypothetical protein
MVTPNSNRQSLEFLGEAPKMNSFFERVLENPTGTAIGLLSGAAIVVGLGLGLQRGAFNPDPQQQQLETKQQNHALQKQAIALANERFDAGCEGVFYLKPGNSTYQPLTENVGVLSGEYWQRWNKAQLKPKPNPTDYLPAGTTVCDAYGNVGILIPDAKKGHAIVSDLLNTPDRNRIAAMMNRYPTAHRPQVGS